MLPAFGLGSGVMKPCLGLAFSAPAGPRQHFIHRCTRVQVQVHEQPSHFGHGEGDQAWIVAGSPFSAWVLILLAWTVGSFVIVLRGFCWQ